MREEIDVTPQMAKPEFGPSKPLFENGKALPEGEVAPEATEYTQPATEASPPATQQAGRATRSPEPPPSNPPPPENGGFNVIKAVRNLCKAAKVKENDLLGFLFEIGAASANYGSLEELHMSQNEVLQMVSDQFGDISQRILVAKEGK